MGTSGNAGLAPRIGRLRSVSLATMGHSAFALAISKLLLVDYVPTVTAANSGAGPSGSSGNVQIAAPTILGAIGTLSYNWSFVSGDATVGITGPTTQRPIWGAANVIAGTPKVAIYRVVVTDSGNGATSTDTVQVTCRYNQIA